MAAIQAAQALNAATRRIDWRSALEKAAVLTGCIGALIGAGMVISAWVLVFATDPSGTTVEALAGGGVYLLLLIGSIAQVVAVRTTSKPPEES